MLTYDLASRPEPRTQGTIEVNITYAGLDAVETFQECMRQARCLLCKDSSHTHPLVCGDRYASAFLLAAFAEFQCAQQF